MWHSLREDTLEDLESKLISHIGRALAATVQRDDSVAREDNHRFILVPCIITGRAMDCISDKLEEFAPRGRVMPWY